MTAKIIMAALATASALAATPAAAATFVFDMTGAFAAKFTLDDRALSPPVESGLDYFVIEDIAGSFAGRTQRATSITFNTGGAAQGGLTVGLRDGTFAGFFGSQLFTGTTTNPLLRTGTYILTSDIDGSIASLSITRSGQTAVPEPGTWVMMLLGFGAVGAGLRRRASVRARVRFA